MLIRFAAIIISLQFLFKLQNSMESQVAAMNVKSPFPDAEELAVRVYNYVEFQMLIAARSHIYYCYYLRYILR